ncbi:response regulator [Leptolyngbya sp. NK1-12]|uniref:Circadian input-output histidine kinase CikA n=1 Tax=Leptolyngbya sp. NK1-12 TaxID=2547451 RepID=A0AA96WKN1_9CYAN|nr:response regulator [Leptolyngbya sp. NK1-12]
MTNFLRVTLAVNPFIPHGHCYLWKPDLVWLHLASDFLIAVAYYSIPFALVYFVQRRRDLPFNWIFLLFGAFIVACGTTHLMEIWTLWHPTYWISGGLKATTAGISLFTAVQLLPLIPKALALPSPAQLTEANQQLEAQIEERQRIEAELRRYQNELELRVQERTAELVAANKQLQREITERQRIENVLRSSQETTQRQLVELESIYRNTPIGLCVLDTEFRFMRINESLAEMNGLPVSEHIGRSVREVLPELGEAQAQIFQQVIQTGTPSLNQEIRGMTPAQPGIERIWRVSYYPLRLSEQQVLGVNIVVQEITEQKQAELERERLLASEQMARAAAEAANRTKDEFLSVLSHELRTPLNAILGWAQMLRSKPQLDAAIVQRALETIERNARGQANLINDLLDISRIITGKLRLNVCPVELITVIEAAIDTVRPAADAKGIQIRAILDPEAGPVSGDVDRLQQVVWNLLSNAVKFTPRGGWVQVRLERVNSQVEIVVSDSGLGINPDFLPFVFDRFQQADSKTTRSHGGLGLGLAIVRHLVELHGGSVSVYSAGLGQGAIFTVQLPLMVAQPLKEGERVHPRADADALRSDLPQLYGLHILVVDDEVDARELIRMILHQCGAEVSVAASASEAIALLDRLQPDLLISDIGMPNEDGYTLIRQLRAEFDSKRLPAVALSAYARVEDRTRALAAGFQLHLAKPVNLPELTAAVASLTGRTELDSCSQAAQNQN